MLTLADYFSFFFVNVLPFDILVLEYKNHLTFIWPLEATFSNHSCFVFCFFLTTKTDFKSCFCPGVSQQLVFGLDCSPKSHTGMD